MSELPQTPQSPASQSPLDPPRTPQRLVTLDPMAEHPSPPSSPGSNKRIADSDIISDLVRSAKASRYNNQLPMQDNDEFGDKSERDLACAICSEIMAHPVACLDCVHIFCGEFRRGEMSGIELTVGVNEGSCLVPWFQRSDTCPTCRQTDRKSVV